MVCAPVRSIIPSLKLEDYLSVQTHKPCSISHLLSRRYVKALRMFYTTNVYIAFGVKK